MTLRKSTAQAEFLVKAVRIIVAHIFNWSCGEKSSGFSEVNLSIMQTSSRLKSFEKEEMHKVLRDMIFAE
jgi:hypothetical protein